MSARAFGVRVQLSARAAFWSLRSLFNPRRVNAIFGIMMFAANVDTGRCDRIVLDTTLGSGS